MYWSKLQNGFKRFSVNTAKLSSLRAAVLLSVGLMLQPTISARAEIVVRGENGTAGQTYQLDGGVTNIYAQQVVNNHAVNKFNKFQVVTDNIVNMHFQQQGSNKAADNLFNFVYDRIDINGTVNAVQNNKIGGNLYFFSSNGMAVGKTGVINAGSLYAVTTGADAMDAIFQKTIKGENGASDQTIAKNNDELLASFNDLSSKDNWNTLVPVNSSGTIVVLGHVNVVNDVTLRAGQVAVGKNITADNIGEVVADGIVNTASVRNGITNFGDLVNINGIANTLGDPVEASINATGEIVLEAKQAGNTLAKTVVYGTVENKKGQIDITATNSMSSKGNASAEVLVGGVVTATTVEGIASEDDVDAGKGNINIKAEASSSYTDAGGYVSGINTLAGSFIGKDGSSLLPDSIDGRVTQSSTSAKVEVATGAVVTAGADLNVNAKATTNVTSELALKGIAHKGESSADSIIPVVAVSVSDVTNTAEVKVAGKLDAKDAVSVQADADLTANMTSAVKEDGASKAQFSTAWNFGKATNTAKVEVAKIAEATTIKGGKVEIAADTNSDFAYSALANSPKKEEAISSAVVVTDLRTDAQVEIAGKIEAISEDEENGLSINANDTIKNLKVEANNAEGMGQLGLMWQTAQSTAGVTTPTVSGQTSTLTSLASKYLPASVTGFDLSEYLKVGASVAVNDGTNNAKVLLYKTADLQSNNTIDVNSLLAYKDAQVLANSQMNAYKPSTNDNYVTADAAVLVSDIDNTSSVVVEAGTASQHAVLDGAKGVNIHSDFRFEYNRLQNMINAVTQGATDIKNAWDGLKDVWKDHPELEAAKEEVDAALKEADAQVAEVNKLTNPVTKAGGVVAADQLANNEATASVLGNFTSSLSKVKEKIEKFGEKLASTGLGVVMLGSSVGDIVKASTKFANAQSYANFAASSMSKGDVNSEMNIAASVIISKMNNASSVDVGAHTNITSASGKTDMQANSLVHDVSIGGLSGLTSGVFSTSSGKIGAIGGTVNLLGNDTHSTVTVADDVKIEAQEVAVGGSNDIGHTSIIAAAGKGGKDTAAVINGMYSQVTSANELKTTINPDAHITATDALNLLNDSKVDIFNLGTGLSLSKEDTAATIGMGVAYNNVNVENIINASGTLNAGSFFANAQSAGTLKAIGVAAAVSAGKAGAPGKISELLTSAQGKVQQGMNKVAEIQKKVEDSTKKKENTGTKEDSASGGSSGEGSSTGGSASSNDASAPAARDGGSGSGFSLTATGSAAVNEVDSTTKANVNTARINITKNGDVSVTASDSSKIGAYAGGAAISVKGGSSSGVDGNVTGTVAVNLLKNNVEALLENSTITNAKDVNIEALSNGETMALGVGLNVHKSEGISANLSANVNYNEINHTVKALAKNDNITANSLSVKAEGRDKQSTGAGNLSVSNANASLGANVSIANLTNTISAGIEVDDSEKNKYQITNDINVQAVDALKITTVGAGITVAINSASLAGMGNVAYVNANNTIDAHIKSKGNKVLDVSAHDVKVEAKNAEMKSNATSDNVVDENDASKFVTIAVSGDVSTGAAGVGASVALNEITNNVTGSVEGGKYTVHDLLVDASGTPSIKNVSVGGAGAAEGVAFAGSVSFNTINNSVTSSIVGGGETTKVLANNNVAVLANSKEYIANYAGLVSGTITGLAAGVAFSKNEITGNTHAIVGKDGVSTNIVALGRDNALTTNTKVADSELIGSCLEDRTIDNTEIERTAENRKGVIVDATATRNLKALTINGGITLTGVSVGGNYNKNEVNGSTVASVVKANINKDTDKVGRNDVYVAAKDYTNASGFIGDVRGAAEGVAVGVSVDHNEVNRSVTTSLQNSEINAKIFEATAVSKQAVSSTGLGAAIAGEGVGAAGMTALTKLHNNTTVALDNTGVAASSILAKATHEARFYNVSSTLGAGLIGVGLGASVDVLEDASQTSVNVTGADAKNKKEVHATGSVDINAENKTLASQKVIAVAGAPGSLGGAIAVNNMANSVDVNLANVDVKSTSANVNICAKNIYDIDAALGAGTGGIVALGASVLVNNIDGRVQTTIANSKVEAGGELTVTAEEERKLKQLVTNAQVGGIGLAANVAVTNIGTNTVSENADEQGIVTNALKIAGMENMPNNTKKSQIKVSVAGSELTAKDEVDVLVNEINNITTTVGSGNVSAIAALVGVGIMHQNRNLSAIVSDTTIKAKRVDVNTLVKGGTSMEVVQGTGSLISGTGANATVIEKGDALLTVKGATITADVLNVVNTVTPQITATATDIAGGAVHGGGSIAKVEVSGNIGGNIIDNTLLVREVNLKNIVKADNGKYTAQANAIGGSGALLGDIAVTKADTVLGLDSQLTVNGNTYATQTKDVIIAEKRNEEGNVIETTKESITYGTTKLNVINENTTDSFAEAKSISIGGVISCGHNYATNINTSKNFTNVGFASNAKYDALDTLNVMATTSTSSETNADGSGGSLGYTFGLSAKGVNKQLGETTVNVGGNVKVVNDVNLKALQDDDAEMKVSSFKISPAGYAGIEADNTFNGTTKVKLDKANINTNSALNISAQNNISFNKSNKDKFALETSSYNFNSSIQAVFLNNTVNKNAIIDVLNSTLQSLEKQTLLTSLNSRLNTRGSATNSGICDGLGINLNTIVNNSNSINVDSASVLRTNGSSADLILSTNDVIDNVNYSLGKTAAGALAVVTPGLNTTLNRNNSISITGNLYSERDVNLYAGKDESGVVSSLNLRNEIEAFNRSVLPIYYRRVDNNMQQANTITVGAGGKVSSIRDINAFADRGREAVTIISSVYTPYYNNREELFTSNTMDNTYNGESHASNEVVVNGVLTAGINNKLHITIGNVNQFAVYNDELREAIKKYYEANASEAVFEFVDKDNVTITVDNPNFIVESIKKESFDYANSLVNRYNALEKLINSYSDNEQSAAYIGYKAEQNRIYEQLSAMNLLQEVHNDKGPNYFVPVSGAAIIDSLVLPNIKISGGDINIKTGTLSGNGKLLAQGAPEVSITNNTNLYLKVNDILIEKPGGKVIYNDVVVPSENGNEVINTQNIQNGKTATFSEITSITNDSSLPHISITGNYNGNEVKAYISDAGEQKIISTLPRADIEINGFLSNSLGDVTVISNHNNILIQGTDVKSAANIVGKEVHLQANNGSVTQAFFDGIKNTGGSVQTQYDDLYKKLIAAVLADKKTDANINNYISYGFVDDINKVSTGGSTIAGSNIYINASDVNINGHIQSGFANYSVTIPNDDTVKTSIQNLQANWQASGKKALSDNAVLMNDEYCIVKGGVVWDSVKQEYRNFLSAYYNPDTDTILIPDVDASGGKIYLNGRISSTGGGSIKAVDGAYDIIVKNETDKDLQVGKLVSNNNHGLISITDVITDSFGKLITKTTEYTRGQTVIKGATLENDIVISSTGADLVYNPEAGLRYNWTTGQEKGEKRKYSNTIKAGLWGAIETMNSTTLKDQESILKPVSVVKEGETDNKLNGEYVGKVNDIGVDNSKDFALIYTNTINNEKTSNPVVERWSTGFLGWFKWEKYTWETKSNTTQEFVASVKADKPISIGFMGNSDGNSTIDVSSNASLILEDKIVSASQGYGSVINLSAKNTIFGDRGYIVGDNVNLVSGTGIYDLQINALSNVVKVNAVNNALRDKSLGDIQLNVQVKNGIGIDNNVQPGDVLIAGINNSYGDVSLSTNGNIKQVNTDLVAIIGNRIDLITTKGAVGTTDHALKVNVAQTLADPTDSLSASLNIEATDNINVEQENGDLRIGRIYTNADKDVKITVSNGSLMDALPSGTSLDRGDLTDLLDKWISAGVIEGDAGVSERARYELEQIGLQYDKYLAYKNIGYDHLDEKQQAEWTQLDQMYNKYTSREECLDALGTKYWNKDQLLYSIQNAIVNPSSTSVDNKIKDPNIKGHNITLNVSNGIGMTSDKRTYIDSKTLFDGTHKEELDLLVKSDAANVFFNKNTNEFVVVENNPIGIQATGALNAQAENNVFISGRVEDGSNAKNPLNLNLIVSNGDVRLQSKDGIFNVNSKDDIAAVKGNNLLLQAGEGNIGEADKKLNIDITGALQATAGQNIYLNQINNQHALNIYSMSAGENVYIQAAGNVNSINNLVGQEDSFNDGGYIRSDNANIYITADSIGTSEQALRIKNSEIGKMNKVYATSNGDIILEGISTAPVINDEQPAAGTMFIGKLDNTGATGNANITVKSNGNLDLHGDDNAEFLASTRGTTVTLEANNNIKLNGGKTTTATASLSLNAVHDVDLDAGIISSGEYASGSVLNVTAGDNVHQNVAENDTESMIKVHDLNLATGGSQIITGGNNYIVYINSSMKDDAEQIKGEIRFNTNDNTNGIRFNDVKVTEDVTVNVNGGNIKLTGAGVESAKNFNLTARSEDAAYGNVDFNINSIKGQNIYITADGIIGKSKGDVSTKLEAVKDVTLISNNSWIHQVGEVKAGNNVKLEATNGVNVGGVVTADHDVVVTVKTNNITVTGNVQAENDIKLEATTNGNITINNSILAGHDAIATTNSGNINVNNDVVATTGAAKFETETGDIIVGHNLSSKNVEFTTANGAITIGNDLTVGYDAILTSTNEGSISIGQNAQAEHNLTINSAKGDFTVGQNAGAGNDLSVIVGEGDIVIGNDVYAANNVNFTAQNGNIDVGNSVISNNTNFFVENGVINIVNNVIAEKDVTFNALGTNSSINVGFDITAGGDVTIYEEDGDITVGHDVTATNGSATIRTDNGIINIGANVVAGEDANFTAANGNINIGANVTATNANFETNKDILVGNTVTTSENAIFTTNGGTIDVDCDVNATGNVEFVAQGESGKIDIGHDVSAGNDLILTVDKGNIEIGHILSAGNDAKVTTKDGNIKVVQDIIAGNEAVFEATNGNIDIQRDAFSSNVDFKVTNGKIDIGNDVNAEKNIKFEALGNNSSIIVANDVIAGNNIELYDEDGDITIGHNLTAKTGDAKVTAANGNINISADVSAEGVAYFTANAGDITINQNLISGDAKFTTTNGKINIGVDVNVKGDAEFTAQGDAGAITIGGNVTAAEDLDFYVENGDVALGKDLISENGSIIVVTENGQISVNDDIEAENGNITLVAKGDDGKLNIGWDISAGEDLFVYSETGMDIGKALNAGDNLTIAANNGNITVGEDVISENKNVNIYTNNGDIDIKDIVNAYNDINIETNNGIIFIGVEADTDFDTTIEANNGAVNINVKEQGAITVLGDIWAQDTISMKVKEGVCSEEDGNLDAIYINDSVISNSKDVLLEVDDGDIHVADKVIAANDFYAVINHDGDINIGSDGEEMNVQVADGTMWLEIANQGDIEVDGKINVGEDVEAHVGSGTIDLEQVTAGRDVTIKVDNEGLVLLQNIVAQNKVTIDIDDFKPESVDAGLGYTITADKIDLIAHSKDSVIYTDNLIVGSELSMAATNVYINGIKRIDDSTGVLEVNVAGPKKQEAANELLILNMNSLQGTRFNQLWVNETGIEHVNGKLDIDKVQIQDYAGIVNNGIFTEIYGAAKPEHVGDVIYWTDPSKNPVASGSWDNQGTAGDWMYLHFTNNPIEQYSNGVLLSAKPGMHIFPWRRSVEDEMRYQLSKNIANVYSMNYEPGIAFFYRNNLYDFDEAIQVQPQGEINVAL